MIASASIQIGFKRQFVFIAFSPSGCFVINTLILFSGMFKGGEVFASEAGSRMLCGAHVADRKN